MEDNDQPPFVEISEAEIAHKAKIQQLFNVAKKVLEENKSRSVKAFTFYFTSLIIVGIAVWWITTSPSRASLEAFNKRESLPLKINILHSSGDEKYIKLIKKSEFESLLPGNSYGQDYWEIQKVSNHNYSFDNFDSPKGSGNAFNAKIALVPESEFATMASVSQCDVYVTADSKIVMKNEPTAFVSETYDNFMTNDWLGISRIHSMIDRVKNMEEDIKDNSPDVWNEISISAAYNLHLIFVHENGDNSKWNTVEANIIKEVNKMVNYLSDTMFFSVTTEHFWDIFNSQNFYKDKGANRTLSFNAADMSKFITAIDELSSPIVSTDPLLKFVFVLTENGIKIDGIQSNGQTFASWGSIINVSPTKNDNYLNAIYESFHSLLGAQQTFSNDRFCSSVAQPNHFVWNRFRRHAFLENILKAKHFVSAINTLAAKMPQLVITSEVGELVRKSKRYVEEAIHEQNPLKAAVARLLAERAADHSSLIGTGDLTSSLKIGIYVPIGMPLLLPIVEVSLKYLWGRFRNNHIKTD